jgi:hypothetical protein
MCSERALLFSVSHNSTRLVPQLRQSLQGHRPRYPSTSHSSLGTQNDQSLGSPFAYSRTSSQQWVPPTIQGGGGSSPCADPYASVYPLTSVSEMASEAIQFPVPSNTSMFATPDPQYQISIPELEPGPSNLSGRCSEVLHTLIAPNAEFEFNFRTQHPYENQPPIPKAHTPHHENSGPSLASSSAQYPAARSTHILSISGPPSHTHRSSVAFLPFVDPPTSLSSSDLQDDFIDAPPSASPASDDGSSQVGDHNPSQQGTSSTTSEAKRKIRRSGKRKRVDNPKDEKAAKRLRDQRQIDTENLEKLRKLLRVGEVQKKELTAARTSQSSRISWMMKYCFQWSTKREGS